MNEWLTNVSNLISVLSAAGLLGGGMWLYRRENKRIKRAEANGAEMEVKDKTIMQYERLIDTMGKQETDLKQELKEAREEAKQARSNEAKERDKVTGLFRELSDARVDAEKLRGALAIAEYNKCEVVRCNRRQPPRTEQTEREQ